MLILISKPIVNFDNLINSLGKGILEEIDRSGLDLTDSKKLVLIIQKFINGNCNPFDLRSIELNFLSHLNFTFLTVLDDYSLINLLSKTKLEVSQVYRNGANITFISGNLVNWINAAKTSLIGNLIIGAFNSLELGELFDGCKIQSRQISRQGNR